MTDGVRIFVKRILNNTRGLFLDILSQTIVIHFISKTAQYNQRNPRFHSVDEPLDSDEELQEQIALFEHKIVDISALIKKHKANDELETAEACEKIKQVYENELHYVLTGERVKLPWEDDLFADD